jgi:hypothetical protein
MKIGWDRLAILQMYMAVGGIPYYLSLLQRGESVAQAIDRLFFARNAPLRDEYERLFASLFRKPEPYLEILKVLSSCRQGVTREEIAKAVGTYENGHLSDYLKNLIRCDFVRYYYTRSTKIKKTDGLYQLTDFFVIFYNTFVKNATTDEHFWTNHLLSPTLNTWFGLTFERVCMAHIPQIKKALGIDRIGTEYYSWRSKQVPRAQVDMIIERADHLINLCEIKYTMAEYTITASEDMKLRNRISTFIRESKTKSAVIPTWITPYGLSKNEYSANIMYQVTINDLFT